MPATSRPNVTLPEAPEIAAAISVLRAAHDRIFALGLHQADRSEAFRMGMLAHALELADDVTFDVLNTAQAFLACQASADAIETLRTRPPLRPVS